MYSSGSEELHTIHDQFMSTISLFRIRQERGQLVQSFRDKFIAVQQVCEQLGLTIRQSEQGLKAVLKKQGIEHPTTKQLSQAKEKAVEEFFAKNFIYMADCQKHGKIIKEMEKNEVLQTKDPFPKNISDACMLLNGWQNNYGEQSVHTKANDGVAFATMSE